MTLKHQKSQDKAKTVGRRKVARDCRIIAKETYIASQLRISEHPDRVCIESKLKYLGISVHWLFYDRTWGIRTMKRK